MEFKAQKNAVRLKITWPLTGPMNTFDISKISKKVRGQERCISV